MGMFRSAFVRIDCISATDSWPPVAYSYRKILVKQLLGQLFDDCGFTGSITAKDCNKRHRSTGLSLSGLGVGK